MPSRRSKALRYAFAAAAILTPLASRAITLLPECATTSDPEKAGNCGITDLLSVFANFGEILLGISGAIALGFFVWGGFQMILSGGNSEMVKKGKETIVRATIGIFIIFLSGVIVRFTGQALTGAAGNVCSDTAANKSLTKAADITKKKYVDSKGNACVPKLGDSCDSSFKGGSPNGIWVSIPAGFNEGTDGSNPDDYIPEGLVCIKHEFGSTPPAGCGTLNDVLKARSRPEAGQYSCISTSSPKASKCVRGLCGGGADFACCITVK